MFPSLMFAVLKEAASIPFDPTLDISLITWRTSPYTWGDVRDIDLSADGTKMLIIYWINNSGQRIEQYNLTTPFAIANMTTDHVMGMPSWSDSANRNSRCVRFANNWTMLFYQVSNRTYTWDLTVPYDISWWRTNNKIKTTASFWSFDFTPDWTKLIWGNHRDWHIYEFTMSTAWDISTATLTKTNSTLWTGYWFNWFTFSGDWKYIYIWHSNWYSWANSERISRLDLSSAYNIDTLSHSWLSFNPWLIYPSAFRYVESVNRWYRWSGWNALREYDVTPS